MIVDILSIAPKHLYTIAFYIVAMVTTIQVSSKLMAKLKQMKLYNKESYEDVVWDLIEDTLELSDETKKHIAQSEKEIREGKTVSLEEIKKKLKIGDV
jgi:predicted transcriptional regulator